MVNKDCQVPLDQRDSLVQLVCLEIMVRLEILVSVGSRDQLEVQATLASRDFRDLLGAQVHLGLQVQPDSLETLVVLVIQAVLDSLVKKVPKDSLANKDFRASQE
jgi:hypothetical protein